MLKLYLATLGCKLNQAEAESWMRCALQRGLLLASDPAEADWAVVNTCAVTHVAARKSRQLIRQLYHSNPGLRIAVTGCYAELAAQELRTLPNVELVLGNAAKEELIERLLASVEALPSAGSCVAPQALRPLASGRTRALVKIQDGCDNHCTYCVVRVARGPQRSRPPEEIVAEASARIAEGYREIVLTGVHIGAYGRDSAPGAPPEATGWSLARLVGTLLERTAIARLRLSSIEPWDFSSELLDAWQDTRLCRHVHLPLQSGCDATLARMGRKYTSADYRALVDDIRARIPDVALTTDVIVGFPGESDQEFVDSLALVQQVGFARLHVFRYSPRAGTPAVRFPQRVPDAIAQARGRELMALGKQLAAAFHLRFVGRQVEVLFETASEHGNTRMWNGLTDNYLRVQAPSALDLHNTVGWVHCLQADDAGLCGELLPAAT